MNLNVYFPVSLHFYYLLWAFMKIREYALLLAFCKGKLIVPLWNLT